MKTGATTPSIVVACVLAVVCKRMQQLPTSLGPAGHCGKMKKSRKAKKALTNETQAAMSA